MMGVYEWSEMRIGDLGDVFTGRTPSSENPAYFGNVLPFITPGDMRQGKYARVTDRSLSLEGAELLKRIRLPANAVCVSCIGWQMGEVVMTDRPSITNQQINSIVPNGKVEPSFLYYSLRPRKQELLALGTMAGVRTPILNKSAFCDLKVQVPPLPIQHRIAGVLSAYDELIENSQRRIKILEAMARALFREWFVHFRFPGHESVPLVPSPLGEIPQGWEVHTLEELCSRMESGGTPKRSNSQYWEGGEIDWYKTGELWDGFLFESEEKITSLGQRQSTARLFEPGTILMAIYGSPTVGRMGILTKHASCNQAALGLMANVALISQTYLYLVLFSLREQFNSLAQGAAQQNISKEKVASARAVVPLRDILDSFDNIAEPIFSQIRTLQRKIQNLRRTRDLLLPRLLSGKIVLEGP